MHGDVVTAELAALLAYGHRRIAQRRLARLAEYGLVTGFWAANRQRPRGRHAYALTRLTRLALERMIWPNGRKKLYNDAPESVSPVIHGLASHDVFTAFLRASDPENGVGLAAWVPERPLIRLVWHSGLRPDALAVIRVGEASIVLALERDLGTERGPILAGKVESYQSAYDRQERSAPVHVGFVVDSVRRAASVRARLRSTAHEDSIISVWVITGSALAADPYHAVWTGPDGMQARTVDFAPHWRGKPWGYLRAGDLADPANLEVLDDRVIGWIPLLASARSY